MMQGSLAHKLRVLRAERGLTLREAAAKSGVAKETISDIERGLRHPHDPTIAKIAKGYGVPVDELLEEPVPLAEAPKEVGLPSVTDLVSDAAKMQALLESLVLPLVEQQSEALDQLRGQGPINEAYLHLLERSPGDVAKACTDLALRNVQSEKELARAREEIAALREREQAHS
jgi:transcriptional regulator with XRE-family HTH domain